MTKTLVLASASPRRRELLDSLSLRYRVMPSDVDEATYGSSSDVVCQNALLKAKFVAEALAEDFVVIGADTVVSIDGKILGKPCDKEDARQMLQYLSGREHFVYSGIAVVDVKSGKAVCGYSSTRVLFAAITSSMIDFYLQGPEAMDKAGSYAVQGKGALFVQQITGDYGTVAGMSLPLLHKLLQRLSLDIVDYMT